MIPETQQELIIQALVKASFSEKVSFHQLTVHDIVFLSEKLYEIMSENGYSIYQDQNLKREKLIKGKRHYAK